MTDRYPPNSNLFKKIYSSSFKPINKFYLFNSVKDSISTVQRLKLLHKLPVHNGCVNSICWSENGEFILSGSDDQRLCITNAYTTKVQKIIPTRHRTNIFSAKFLPNSSNQKIISCSGDGIIMYTDVARAEENWDNLFNCHFGTAYKIVTIPNDSNTFLTCGEDGTVRWYDLRVKQSCNLENCREDILVDCRRAVTAVTVNHLKPYELAVGCADNYVHMFDRRKVGTRATGSTSGDLESAVLRFTVPTFENKSHRITSLVYSTNAEEILVSYSSEYLYLFGLKGGAQTFSPSTSSGEGSSKCLSTPPPMKRWRLRGDWSDTGPNARPEREMQGGEVPQRPSVQSILIRRMSDVLTRILNQPSRNSTRSTTEQSEGNPNPPTEEEEEENIEEPEERDPVILITPIVVSMDEDSEEQPSQVETTEPQQTQENTSPIDTNMEILPSTSSTSTDTTVTEPAVPGQKVLQESFTTLEKQLSTRRKHFLKRHHVEPVVNLHYNAKGATSGVISLGMGEGSEKPCTEETTGDENPEMDVQNEPGNENENETENSTMTVEIPTISIDEASTNVVAEQDRTANDEITSTTEISDEESDELSEWASGCTSRRPKAVDDVLTEDYDEKEQVSSDQNKVYHLPTPLLIQKYTGHRNARTMIKEANFWGENFIISGSDCGHIFFWDRHTAEVVMILEADHHVVNCVQPHPFDPVLASSGIDYDVKLWAPLEEEANFNEIFAFEIMRRNEVMLEETRDTITVPASFMIRMLASLSNRRPSVGARLRSALADRNNNNN